MYSFRVAARMWWIANRKKLENKVRIILMVSFFLPRKTQLEDTVNWLILTCCCCWIENLRSCCHFFFSLLVISVPIEKTNTSWDQALVSFFPSSACGAMCMPFNLWRVGRCQNVIVDKKLLLKGLVTKVSYNCSNTCDLFICRWMGACVNDFNQVDQVLNARFSPFV